MKDNVAGKLRRYTNTTLHKHDVVLADRIGSVASENSDRQVFLLAWFYLAHHSLQLSRKERKLSGRKTVISRQTVRSVGTCVRR